MEAGGEGRRGPSPATLGRWGKDGSESVGSPSPSCSRAPSPTLPGYTGLRAESVALCPVQPPPPSCSLPRRVRLSYPHADLHACYEDAEGSLVGGHCGAQGDRVGGHARLAIEVEHVVEAGARARRHLGAGAVRAGEGRERTRRKGMRGRAQECAHVPRVLRAVHNTIEIIFSL